MIALATLLLAAAPEQARFALEVAGLPVAELRITVTNDRYLYEATHFLEEGPKEHRVELPLSKGAPVPEVLALLHRPKPGCRDVLEERTKKLEKLCVARGGSETRGTIDGEAFTARYDSNDALAEITVGAAKWIAVTQAVQPPAESPFVRGVAVPRGSLRLDPPVEGAKWLTTAPVGTGTEASRARCLVLAREAAKKRPGAEVTVGLVIEDGRAYPHAWVTEEGLASDPSVVEGDPILATRRYLELPKPQSGRFYLRFFDGAVRLVPR